MTKRASRRKPTARHAPSSPFQAFAVRAVTMGRHLGTALFCLVMVLCWLLLILWGIGLGLRDEAMRFARLFQDWRVQRQREAGPHMGPRFLPKSDGKIYAPDQSRRL